MLTRLVYHSENHLGAAGGTMIADLNAILDVSNRNNEKAGITGKITFANGSHIPQKGVTLVKIDGGKLTLAAEVVPEAVPAANPDEGMGAAATATAEATP